MSLSINPNTYRTFLEKEFEIRKTRNPSYSLRAYARSLGIAAPKLSQILRGLCGLSKESAKKISERIGLEGNEQELFVTLVESEHSRSKFGKSYAKAKLDSLKFESYDLIALEKFQIISDWWHFAILELTNLKSFKSDPAWIAKRLNISKEQASKAIELLLDHGLLKYDSSKKNLKQTHANLATPTTGIPSQHIRSHHTQILSKAITSLETVGVAERDFSSNTLSIDATQIEEARKALREFRRKFCKKIQINKPQNRIYCLSMQFFPLDQNHKEN